MKNKFYPSNYIGHPVKMFLFDVSRYFIILKVRIFILYVNLRYGRK